jgi:hypothetical protein
LAFSPIISLPRSCRFGQPLEEQDALDQPVGVLHLVDRLLLLVLLQLLQAPVAEHAGVQEVLVDRGELVIERLVEVLDDFRVAFHACDCTLNGATRQA